MSKFLIADETIKGLIHGIYDADGKIITYGIAHGLSMTPLNAAMLQYIESTGKQNSYIKLPIHAFGDLGIEIEFETGNPLASNANYGSIFGCRLSTKDDEFHLTTMTTSSFPKGIFRYGDSEVSAGIASGGIQVFSFKQSSGNKNNMTISTTGQSIAKKQFFGNCQLVLGALNTNGSINTPSITKIYNVKLFAQDAQIAEYVPCKLDTGAIGLYDVYCHEFVSANNMNAGPEIRLDRSPIKFSGSDTNMTKYNNDDINHAALNMFNDTLPQLDPPSSLAVSSANTANAKEYRIKIVGNPTNYQFVHRYLLFLNNEHVGDISSDQDGNYENTYVFPRKLNSGDVIGVQAIHSVDLYKKESNVSDAFRKWSLTSPDGSNPILSINSKFKPSELKTFAMR